MLLIPLIYMNITINYEVKVTWSTRNTLQVRWTFCKMSLVYHSSIVRINATLIIISIYGFNSHWMIVILHDPLTIHYLSWTVIKWRTSAAKPLLGTHWNHRLRIYYPFQSIFSQFETWTYISLWNNDINRIWSMFSLPLQCICWFYCKHNCWGRLNVCSLALVFFILLLLSLYALTDFPSDFTKSPACILCFFIVPFLCFIRVPLNGY